MTRRRDPNSWTVVRLPERDLAELILELVAPLLDRLGPTRTIEDARGALDLAVMFWNASVLAAKHWPHPRARDLNELRHRMRGRHATPDDAATFDLLVEGLERIPDSNRRPSAWEQCESAPISDAT